MSLEDYEKLAAQKTHNSLMAGFITSATATVALPPTSPVLGDGPELWKKVHETVLQVIRAYYETKFEPRDVVCIATSEDEYKIAEPIQTYGGTRIVLVRFSHSYPTRHNGIFGPDLELVRSAHSAALAFIDKTQSSMLCEFTGPGRVLQVYTRCVNNRNLLRSWLQQIKGIEAGFEEETERYVEYAILSPSRSGDLDLLTAFYEQVAALNSVDSVIGIAKQIPAKKSDNQTVLIPALIYDPVAVGTASELAFFGMLSDGSFLDFAEGWFISELPTYYIHIFAQLAAGHDWSTKIIRRSSLKPIPTFIIPNDDTAVSVSIAELLCAEKSASVPKYGELISGAKRAYVQNHITYFCTFLQGDNMQVLDASELLKTDDTLPATLNIDAIEKADNNITTALVNLSQITLHQAVLLNGIKQLIGKWMYEGRIAALQAAIDKAEAEMKKQSVLGILQNVANGVAAIGDLSNLVTGATALVSKVAQMPTGSNDSMVLYLASQQEEINGATDKLGRGAHALSTLESVIQSFSPDSNAAKQLADLKAQLEQVRNEYAKFQAGIAQTVAQHNRDYLTLMLRLNDLSRERQAIFLGTQATITKAVIKNLVGARLKLVTDESRQNCPESVASFFQLPAKMTFGTMHDNCVAYSPATRKLMECLDNAKRKRTKDLDLLWGSEVGLRIATDRQKTACIQR
jgi:hypothetical protein